MARRLLIFILVACLGYATLPRCVGSFALTSKGYGWIQSIENKWLRWIVFFVFAIWPLGIVGAVFILADLLVINSIEFWTGDNIVAAGDFDENGEFRRTARVEDARVDFVYRDFGGTLEMHIFKEGAGTSDLVRTIVLKKDLPGRFFTPRADGGLAELDVDSVSAGDVRVLRVLEDGVPVQAKFVPEDDFNAAVDHAEQKFATARQF